MGNRIRLLAFALPLLAGLAVLENGDAQQPFKKGPFGKKGAPLEPITADQIVERILSFDKNADGKITLEELPERMQHLLALGDVDKDGFFDKGEIQKLAATLEAFTGLTSPAGPGFAKGPGKKGGGIGDGFKGAKKGDGKKGAFKGPVAEVESTLDELNVSGATRDQADRLLSRQRDKLRRFEEVTRAELIIELKDVLIEEDYRILKSALDRPAEGPFPKKGPPGKGPKGPFGKGPPAKGLTPPETIGRIDQLQKDLDDLRRKLPK